MGKKDTPLELLVAIKAADFARVKEIVEGGASLAGWPDGWGSGGEKYPLVEAAGHATPEIVRYFATKGQGINQKDTSGDTPLFQAVTKGKVDNVLCLLLNFRHYLRTIPKTCS